MYMILYIFSWWVNRNDNDLILPWEFLINKGFSIVGRSINQIYETIFYGVVFTLPSTLNPISFNWKFDIAS